MKTSHDRDKSSKSHTAKASEPVLSPHSRNGSHHEKQPTRSPGRWTHPRSHKENEMPPPAGDTVPGQRGAQTSDVCNGNLSLGHVSQDINPETSKKLPRRDTKRNRNEDGVLKNIPTAQKVRDEPKDSPSRDVFLFWANKVNGSGQGATFHKVLQKSSMTSGSVSPALLPKEGPWEEEKSAKNPPRKTRRDLFSDSKVFSHVDAHVLHMSQQVGAGVPLQVRVLPFSFYHKLMTAVARWWPNLGIRAGFIMAQASQDPRQDCIWVKES